MLPTRIFARILAVALVLVAFGAAAAAQKQAKRQSAKIEKAEAGENNTVEFSEVLAVSGEAGSVTQPAGAKVIGTILGEGRGAKILVFHYKRKKQYKKLQGHRQAYTEVRINEIQVDGATYTAAK